MTPYKSHPGRVGGDLHLLANLKGADLQLVHVELHFQIAHIVDGAEVLHGGVVGAELVAGLDLLIHDGAADRGVDGIVADVPLCGRHPQLGGAEIVAAF